MSFEKIQGPLRGKSTRELSKDCYVIIREGREVHFSTTLIARHNIKKGIAFSVGIDTKAGVMRLIQARPGEFLNDPTDFIVLATTAGRLYFRSEPAVRKMKLERGKSLKRVADTSFDDNRLIIDIYYRKGV